MEKNGFFWYPFPRHVKIQVKISLGMIGLYLGTALATALAIIPISLRTLQSQSTGTLKAVAESLAESYTTFVEYNTQLLRGFADTAEFVASVGRDADAAAAAEQTRSTMAELLGSSPQLADVFIQKDGKILFSGKRLLERPPGSSPAFYRNQQGGIYLILQTRLEDSSGVLGFVVSLSQFTQRHAQSMRVSPHANLFIMDLASRRIVVDTDSTDLVSPAPGLLALFPRSPALLADGSHAYKEGKETMIAYIVRRGSLAYGIRLDQGDLLADTYLVYRLLVAIIAFSALAFVALALFLARGISKPVMNLAKAAHGIASRDYTVRVSVRSGDEMEILGKAFNQMAEHIQSFTENLEHLVSLRTEELREKIREVEELSVTDPLTGIYNRKRFDEELGVEIARARRYADPLTLIMFDIDHFKAVNDSHGHAAGDLVLKEIAALVKSMIRSADVFSRWGGEEFLVLLPQTDLDGAYKMADKLRNSICAVSFSGVGRVTGSFGVTAFTDIDDRDSFLKRVDDALYEAKDAGRNRVVVS